MLRPPLRVETHHRTPPRVPILVIQEKAPTKIDPPKSDEEKAVEAFQQAADAILSRAPNIRASAAMTERPIGGKVPLPRRRPIVSP